MRAVVVERPGVLRVVDGLPEPRTGAYDAICRIVCGCICTATDQRLVAGTFPHPIAYPLILGHESVGRVVEVGSRVRYLKPGDMIARVGALDADGGSDWGGFAEFGVCRDYRAMREDGLPESAWKPFEVNRPLPADIDAATAAMIVTWRETLSYVRRIGIAVGKRVLILGSGAHGLALARHAFNPGAAEVCMVGNAARANAAVGVGCTHFLDYRHPDFASELERQFPRMNAAAPWLATDGFDVIIDAVGRRGALDAVLGHLKPRGTVGIYGYEDFGQYGMNPQLARGSFYFYNEHLDEAEAHDEVIAMIMSGQLTTSPWIDAAHCYPLAEIHRAFEALRARACIKALIQVDA